MKRRRNQLQPSTFPFMAVLLCAMGSLILLLLILDRRAKLAAQQRAMFAVQQQQGQDAAEHARLLAAQKADWERGRRALHAWLQGEQQQVLDKLSQVQTQSASVQQTIQQHEVRSLQLEKHLQQEQQRLADLKSRVVQRQQLLQQTQTQSEQTRQEMAALSTELQQLEDTIYQLKKLRANSQKTYSLVPYAGPYGDTRQPIYIECCQDRIIFHPDQLTITDQDFSILLVNREIQRRMLALQRAGTGKDDRPYLFLLVRPNGLDSYFAMLALLRSVSFDYGYELIDQDWVLDFSHQGQTLPSSDRPATLAETPPRPGAGTGQLVRGYRTGTGYVADALGGPEGGVIHGLQRGRNRGASFPARGGHEGPPGGTGSGSGPALSLKTLNEGGTLWGASGSARGSPTGVPLAPPSLPVLGRYGTGAAGHGQPPGAVSSNGFPAGEVPGSLPAGVAGGSGSPAGVGRTPGTAQRFMTQPGGLTQYGAGGPGTSPGLTAQHGSGMVPPGMRAGLRQEHGSPGQAPAEPAAANGSAGGAAKTGQSATGPGGGSPPLLPVPLTGGVPGQARLGSPTIPGAAADTAAEPRELPGEGTATPAVTLPTLGRGPQPGDGLIKPAPLPGTPGYPAAGQPQGHDGGAGTAVPGQGQPQGPGQPASAMPGGQPQARMPRQPQRNPGAGVMGSTMSDLEDEVPPPPGPGLPFLHPQKKSAPPPRPVRPLSGSKDWIIPIECKADGVHLPLTRQKFPIALLRSYQARHPLPGSIQELVRRRQSAVRAGEIPYHPMLRFEVYPDGLQAYHLAYPLLERLGHPMVRQNIRKEGDDYYEVLRNALDPSR